MYFSEFPKIYYDASGQGIPLVVTNILRRIAVRSKIKDNVVLYDTYDIKSGDTPESIAHKLYGDPTLHWTILMTNDITDRYHQWPMYEQQFNTYLNEKYSNPDGVHHYEISQSSGDSKLKIDVYANEALYSGDTDFYSFATIVTNREYEEQEQDRKRGIKLIDPRFIDQFVEEFEKIVGESVI